MPTTKAQPRAGADCINAFTIDVEDYFQVAALKPAIARDTWSSRELRVERNTDRLLEMLDRHGTKATFFVLGWVAEQAPALVRRIAAAGHEIACHGYSHELVYSQTRVEFVEETRRAKHCIEALAGRSVSGYRAASFSITRASMWALDVLIDLGFLYDSSIFPIRHDRYGIPGAAPDPGKVQAPSQRSIVEFPMSTAHWFGQRLPVCGGGYFRILPYWFSRAALRSINAANRPFGFYVHPWEIDPEQPRVRVSAFSRFRHYTNLGRCEARLERLLKEFRFGSMRSVLEARGLLSAA
jgi:polysaccharide deacetylase family protein (PEP-CTERM system associated)